MLRLVGALTLLTLWSIPLTRAATFYQRAAEYLDEVGSIDAMNDVRFSHDLLLSYTCSAVVAAGYGALLLFRPRLGLLLPGALLAWSVAEVIWLRPESPIVLIPFMGPFRPAIFSAGALFVLGLVLVLSRRPVPAHPAKEE